MTKTIEAVLAFWFVETPREAWFGKDDTFDRLVGERLGATHDAAAAGGLDDWRKSGPGCLALLILLDQVPRNVFRVTPRAFATDEVPRAIARHALERGFDRGTDFNDDMRLFLYTPFMHSENLGDQNRCVCLFNKRIAAENRDGYAEHHRDIVARFGRFTHRNAILTRESTPEENNFLKQDRSSF